MFYENIRLSIENLKFPCLEGINGSEMSKKFTVSVTLAYCNGNYSEAVKNVENAS